MTLLFQILFQMFAALMKSGRLLNANGLTITLD